MAKTEQKGSKKKVQQVFGGNLVSGARPVNGLPSTILRASSVHEPQERKDED